MAEEENTAAVFFSRGEDNSETSYKHRFERILEAFSGARFDIEINKNRKKNTREIFITPGHRSSPELHLHIGIPRKDYDDPYVTPEMFFFRYGEWPLKFDESTYHRGLSTVFELVCRLAMTEDPDYLVWGHRDTDLFPQNQPIGEHIKKLPQFGLYSSWMLDNLGGVENLFETKPWYTARLTSGHTVVIETPLSWSTYAQEWIPPTDTEYIETATLNDSQR